MLLWGCSSRNEPWNDPYPGKDETANVSYTLFNERPKHLDPVVGGYGERARKLRQAISIAVDYEEHVSIFVNGRGEPAQGPIPPGIFGHESGRSGVNPFVYEWDGNAPRRRPLEDAKRLMVEARYPEGKDAATGKPIVLYLDTVGTGPDARARLNWVREQYAKQGIQLVIRDTDYNRFQDKMR